MMEAAKKNQPGNVDLSENEKKMTPLEKGLQWCYSFIFVC